MSTDVSDELKEFFVEAFEMLEESETSFLQVGKGPDFKTIYSAVFRTFHSLKGAAGMFELLDLQKHMHQLENILSECQPRNVFTQGEVSFFLRGIDAAKKIISGEKVTFDYKVTSEEPSVQAKAPSPEVPAPQTVVKPIESPKIVEQQKPKPQIPKKFVGEAMIIDDEPEILEILEHFLNVANFSVRKFTDPTKALVSLKEKSPDIVFTDMMMPQITGLEVLKKVKELYPDVPVIIVSAYLDKDLLIECIQNGAYSAIEKPFKDSFLISTALTAVRELSISKLLQKSLNLLLYQFADLDDFLIKQGKSDVSKSIRTELQSLIDTQKEFRKLKKPDKEKL